VGRKTEAVTGEHPLNHSDSPGDSPDPAADPLRQGGAPWWRPEALLSLMLAALLWWVLAGGDAASWLVGVPVVAVAVWSAWRLRGGDAGRISLWGLLRFLPFFLWESILGGVDVTSRVLRPRMEIRPGFVSYTTALRSPAARLLFVNCISLLPGTLAADIADGELQVHTLDLENDTGQELSRLERFVAAIYGERL
jgi:multicomponent Na+:H+ antiporter subunit E